MSEATLRAALNASDESLNACVYKCIGLGEQLAAANERIGELTNKLAGLHCVNGSLRSCCDELDAERSLSDKLEKALQDAEQFIDRHSEPWYESGQRLLADTRAVLAEVAAIRAKETT